MESKWKLEINVRSFSISPKSASFGHLHPLEKSSSTALKCLTQLINQRSFSNNHDMMLLLSSVLCHPFPRGRACQNTDEGKGSSNLSSPCFDQLSTDEGNIYLLSFALLLIHAHLAHSEDYGSCNCTWYHQQSHNSATFLQPDTFPHSPAHLFVQLFRASLTSIKEDLIGGGGSQVMIPNSLLLYPEPLVRGGSRGSGDDVNPIHC